MTLELFGEELRKLRQERHISLMDISSSTRINMKFLEAIESGRFSVLPQTYVRAFLREFAESVGANPEEVMKKYDEAIHPQTGSAGLPSQRKDEQEPQREKPSSSPFPPLLQKNMAIAAVVVVAAGLMVYLMSSVSNSPSSQQPNEVSFDHVVKETEAATRKNAAAAPSLPTIAVNRDSLRLEMTTKDSVWMSILIDGTRTEEYLFSPNQRKSWIAKERFSVTMGNAGGATFTLNGKELGVLGKRGAVIRNAIIEESTLRNL